MASHNRDSGIFKNIVIRPAPRRRDLATIRTMFHPVARADDRSLKKEEPPVPAKRPNVRTGPRRCPLCGSTASAHPGLFIAQGADMKCSVCGTVLGKNGGVKHYGIA